MPSPTRIRPAAASTRAARWRRASAARSEPSCGRSRRARKRPAISPRRIRWADSLDSVGTARNTRLHGQEALVMRAVPPPPDPGGPLGRPLRRREDRRLVSGQGCFLDDIADPPRCLHAVFLAQPACACAHRRHRDRRGARDARRRRGADRRRAWTPGHAAAHGPCHRGPAADGDAGAARRGGALRRRSRGAGAGRDTPRCGGRGGTASRSSGTRCRPIASLARCRRPPRRWWTRRCPATASPARTSPRRVWTPPSRAPTGSSRRASASSGRPMCRWNRAACSRSGMRGAST